MDPQRFNTPLKVTQLVNCRARFEPGGVAPEPVRSHTVQHRGGAVRERQGCSRDSSEGALTQRQALSSGCGEEGKNSRDIYEVEECNLETDGERTRGQG